MRPYIILLGKANSDNIIHMATQCQKNDHDYLIFDSRRFGIDVFLYADRLNRLSLKVVNVEINLEQICGVYWDHIELPDSTEADIVNIASMLQVFLTQSQLNWVNSWQAFQFHKTKPSQLRLAESLGAIIPDTYFGNEECSARSFVASNPQCIVKPLHGGRLTQMLDIDGVESLPALIATAPVTIQAFIAGTNVRTFVIGNTLYSAQIDSNHVDFRQDGNITLTPIRVPRHIELLAVRIMRAFHMQWTAIDWRLSEAGEYVFLEANPAPMFTQFETCTGYPLAKALFTLLKVKTPLLQKSPELV